MSSRQLREFLAELDGAETFVLAPESTDSLLACWESAAAEADEAYAQWRRAKDLEAYARYRASADRADAAQDALADRWRSAA